MIGRADFDTAVIEGKKAFDDNFLFNKDFGPKYMPEIMRMGGGKYIIDLQQVRHSGQITARRG